MTPSIFINHYSENIAKEEVSFKHIVITRYWFPIAATRKDDGSCSDAEWFERRYELFKTYCLPSVLGQSEQEFIWIVYFDESAPYESVKQVKELLSAYPHFHVRTLSAFKSSVIRDDLANFTHGFEYLLTTRLDNDDGLHREFIKRLHDAIRPGGREFLNFPVGLIACGERIYLYRHRSNAFISFFEPVEGALTVFCAPHEQLCYWAPIRQLEAWPSFLQVVHGTNLSNKPRGIRVHRTLALTGFEAIPNLFSFPMDESDAGITFENATMGLIWALRDRVLNVAKALLLKRRST